MWSSEHINLISDGLAQEGIIDGSAEQQFAIVNGVKSKLLTQLQTAIQTNEQAIGGLRKETLSKLKNKPSTEPSTDESGINSTNQRESVLSDNEREIYKRIGVLLANNLGLLRKPSPKQPSGMSDSFERVDSELVSLRSKGLSEKKALHTLAKKYHSDTNHEPEAGENMRVVTNKLEEFNRRGSK
jgi:hypothetical protein